MDAYILNDIIQKIKKDKQYNLDRQLFHENYEWLEAFWRAKYGNGDKSFDDFIINKGHFFWNLGEIKDLAREFSSIECVGSSKKPDIVQNIEVAKATQYLRYYSNLYSTNIPNCLTANCRSLKKATGLCIQSNGRKWTKIDTPYSSFDALMTIVRQVRNNLFHGEKMTLDSIQFQRDKILVSISSRITQILLDNLIKSGA